MTEMRAAPEYARAKVWLCFDDNHTHTWLQTTSYIHASAIKACGLLKTAENQFNETKVNGCAVLLLFSSFCCSQQESEKALS